LNLDGVAQLTEVLRLTGSSIACQHRGLTAVCFGGEAQ
jgi:hypothetical protein